MNNNNDTQQLIMTCPSIDAVEDEFRFCNQYEDKNTLYTYDEKSNVLKVYQFLNIKPYDFKLCMGKPDITRDQWNKFLKKIKILSSAVISVIERYLDDTNHPLLCMPSNQSPSTDYYLIEVIRTKGLVMIKPMSSKTLGLLIPFDTLLHKTILRYRQELRNAMLNLIS